jgi:hypothetical protein
MVQEDDEEDNDYFGIPDISDLHFQEWCDIDTLTKVNVASVLQVLLKRIKVNKVLGVNNKENIEYSSKSYDHTHRKQFLNFGAKREILSDLKVKDGLCLLLYYLDSISQVKSEYPYIYGDYDIKSSPSPNYSKFSNLVGWEDSIGKLAELPVFNSSRGTLHAIRNTHFAEVLDYFSVKRGRDIAECKDYQLNNNKINL